MWVLHRREKGERKHRNKRECGESKHEREKAPQREGLSSVGEWTWMRNYIPLPLSYSLCVPTSLLLLLQALQLSLPRHATPHSTTPPYISLLPSLHPSQEVL